MASRYPKRTIKPVVRYQPEEVPEDDYDDSGVSCEDVEVQLKKRFKGEFDGMDDEEEEDANEPNEYEIGDGFAVPDNEVDEPEQMEESSSSYNETDDEDEEDDVQDVPYEEDDKEPDVVPLPLTTNNNNNVATADDDEVVLYGGAADEQ